MRSWRTTWGYPPSYGHRSDNLRPRPLRGLLLIIMLGLGTHASKQSLGPLEPTLHAAGEGGIAVEGNASPSRERSASMEGNPPPPSPLGPNMLSTEMGA